MKLIHLRRFFSHSSFKRKTKAIRSRKKEERGKKGDEGDRKRRKEREMERKGDIPKFGGAPFSLICFQISSNLSTVAGSFSPSSFKQKMKATGSRRREEGGEEAMEDRWNKDFMGSRLAAWNWAMISCHST